MSAITVGQQQNSLTFVTSMETSLYAIILKNFQSSTKSVLDWQVFNCRINDSGTPLRPKVAKVEPHTHTKRYAGNLYGHGKRNGSRARAPYIRTSHLMTFLHEAIFAGRAETKEKRRR